MKFKVGDKVRVREDLEVGKSYNGCFLESSMAKLKGKVVEIEDLDSDSYFIKEDKYYWTEEMFSGLAEEPRNLIPQIAKMLGVEIGEQFYLRENIENDTNTIIYKFVDDGLKLNTDDGWKYIALLEDLLVGKYTIKKLPKKPLLTEEERLILRNIPEKYKYIARDYDGELHVYDKKPKKDVNRWYGFGIYDTYGNLSLFQHLFQFIKWEDSEPYKIQELLEEYEKERIENA